MVGLGFVQTFTFIGFIIGILLGYYIGINDKTE